jgi:hypothetical protein
MVERVVQFDNPREILPMYLKILTANFIRTLEEFLISTAWLSSVCVVKYNIKLFNKRNLYYKYYSNFLLKIRLIRLIKIYFIYIILQSRGIKLITVRVLSEIRDYLSFISL